MILSLEFPDGGSYDHVVKTFKFLNFSIKDLEEKKLAILLPFYVLKLRKEVVSSRSSKRRVELGAEMRTIMDELLAASERAVKTGLLSEPDRRIVLEYTERLYKELYQEYDEFKEADVMLQEKILTYSEEAELRGIEKGLEKAARSMMARGTPLLEVAETLGLPTERLQQLQPH